MDAIREKEKIDLASSFAESQIGFLFECPWASMGRFFVVLDPSGYGSATERAGVGDMILISSVPFGRTQH